MRERERKGEFFFCPLQRRQKIIRSDFRVQRNKQLLVTKTRMHGQKIFKLPNLPSSGFKKAIFSFFLKYLQVLH
jgi:hypothetical protein